MEIRTVTKEITEFVLTKDEAIMLKILLDGTHDQYGNGILWDAYHKIVNYLDAQGTHR